VIMVCDHGVAGGASLPSLDTYDPLKEEDECA
jgi:hypothetical protein